MSEPRSTQNIVAGNLIGSDQTGFKDLGNSAEGVLISGASNNTIGGSLAAAQNLISANHWGISLDGAGATGNLIQRNYIGTDITGLCHWATRSIGVIISKLRQQQHDRRDHSADLGNKIGFQVDAGILVAVRDRE